MQRLKARFRFIALILIIFLVIIFSFQTFLLIQLKIDLLSGSGLLIELLLIFIIFLASYFVFKIYAKYIKPISDLQEVLNNLEIEGDIFFQIPATGIIEIDNMIDQFNRLIERLEEFVLKIKINRRQRQEAQRELENSYRQLEDKNEELIETKQELEASYEQLEAFNEEIQASNSELENSYQEIDNLANNLNQIIYLTAQLGSAIYTDEEVFWKEVFKTAIRVVDEADYGSVYLFKNGKVKFIDAIGHNLSLLKSSEVSEDLFSKTTDQVIIIRDILSISADADSQQSKLLKKASKPIKETISFGLYFKKEKVAGISLDIKANSENSFAEKAISAMQSFQNLASAFYTIRRYHDIHQKTQKEIIYSIIQMLEIHDEYTRGHSRNVAWLGEKIAKKMGMSEKECEKTYWTGMVHDIGKILIPENILNKHASLSDQEYTEIQKHPLWGYQTLQSSEELKEISQYVLYHHEYWNGHGYPEGVTGDQIPLISQIICVADSWDAMRSNRSYREALSKDVALAELAKFKGEQFSPDVVEAFQDLLASGEVS